MFAVLVVVVVAAVAFGATRVLGSGGTPTAITRTVDVTSGTMQRTVTASGTISTASTANLNFAAAGQVTAVSVTQGQKVKKNQVLARIDSASLASQVAAANATVASAQSRLAGDQSASASDAQLNADYASLAAAQSDLSVAQDALSNADLRAPIAGTV
ncbi:MAG: biotin/lipoyl-binding protein, partial [Actinomycetes bacterium]